MGGNWIRSRQGRWVMAAGAVAVVAAVSLFVLTNDDSGTTSGDESSVVSVSTSDQAGPTTDPPTSDPIDTSESTLTTPTTPTSPAPPATSEAGSTVAPGTLATVPVGTVVVLDPIPLDETGDFGTGLSVQLVGIEAIEGEARTQGEVGGPALRVEVEMTNESDEPLSLERTQVEITYGEDRTPGIELTGSGTTSFAESVAPGESSTAVVVFLVPLDQRELVQVAVTETTGTPIIVFEGSAP